MNQLLAALGDDIKPAGRDKWTARCPVHGDKDFAMSIKQEADSSIKAYCFACGANGLHLYKHLQLDLSELFGGREMERQAVPPAILAQYKEDRVVCQIYDNDKAKGRTHSYKDEMRYKLGKARMRGIENKWPNMT